MNVTFENDERWNMKRSVVTFWAEVDGERFRCIASAQAIRQLFRGSGHREDSLRLFREHRAEFEKRAETLIRRGLTVPVFGESFKEVQITTTLPGVS